MDRQIWNLLCTIYRISFNTGDKRAQSQNIFYEILPESIICELGSNHITMGMIWSPFFNNNLTQLNFIVRSHSLYIHTKTDAYTHRGIVQAFPTFDVF